MSGIEQIMHGEQVLAIILRSGVRTQGVRFFTPNDYPLQLGLLTHPKGTYIKPHMHPKMNLIIETIQEVLYIRQGSIELDIYSENGQKIESQVLKQGDCVLLVSGGHGLRVLEDSIILEVKQGPYMGPEKAKIYFSPEGHNDSR